MVLFLVVGYLAASVPPETPGGSEMSGQP